MGDLIPQRRLIRQTRVLCAVLCMVSAILSAIVVSGIIAAVTPFDPFLGNRGVWWVVLLIWHLIGLAGWLVAVVTATSMFRVPVDDHFDRLCILSLGVGVLYGPVCAGASLIANTTIDAPWLAFAIWLALIAIGGFVAMDIAITIAIRRAWIIPARNDDLCKQCGYRIGPSQSDICPECGRS